MDNLKDFTPAEIKAGMLVVLRNGKKCVAIPTESYGIEFAHSNGVASRLNAYSDQLTRPNSNYDIMEIWGFSVSSRIDAIFETKNRRALLWARYNQEVNDNAQRLIDATKEMLPNYTSTICKSDGTIVTALLEEEFENFIDEIASIILKGDKDD